MRKLARALLPPAKIRRAETACNAAPYTASLSPCGHELLAQVADVVDETSSKSTGIGPEKSWIEITYPFTRSSSLRDEYVHPNGKWLRWGRLLEAVDSLSGDVAFKHAVLSGNKVEDFVVVTAAHDRLSIAELDAHRDLRLRSYASRVGNSSMEVRTDIAQLDTNGDEYVVGEVFTVMVGRQSQRQGPIQFAPLSIASDDAEERDVQALENQKRRKALMTNALKLRPPTSEEVPVLHELSLQQVDMRYGVGYANCVYMSDTEMKGIQIMHYSNRNAHGKIFGGYLMRKAFELAHICAASFLRSDSPSFIGFDDVYFCKPVSVGDVWASVARVVYSSADSVRIHVESDLVDVYGNRDRTNEFTFIFRSPVKKDLPIVVPRTYKEGMLMLEGRRRSVPR